MVLDFSRETGIMVLKEVRRVQRFGYLHDMMDVKILILFIMSRVKYPVTIQQIYELCYQDDSLSYFDVCTAVPEMVTSGHLQETEDGSYIITAKGREDGETTKDDIAFTVKQNAENAVDKFNRQVHRSSFVKTRVESRENGDYSVIMQLDDALGTLMTMELTAPDSRQAVRLSRLLEKKAEAVYNLTMAELLDEEEME